VTARRLKTFALSAAAVLAFCVAAAPSAEAVPEFKAAKYPAQLEGVSEGVPSVFNLGGTQASCGHTTLSGELEKASSVLMIGRSYSECTMKISLITYATTIKMNECSFRLTLTEEVDAVTFEAHVDLVCPVGKELEILVYENATKHTNNEPMCAYKIPPQAVMKSVQLKDVVEEFADVRVVPTVKEIAYERFIGAAGKCGQEFGENGTYTGSTTMIAKNGGKQINVEVK
jgi:hypothetical protein